MILLCYICRKVEKQLAPKKRVLRKIIWYKLTYFMPLVSFDTPWKHQKTSGFLMFSGTSKETSDWNGLSGITAWWTCHKCFQNTSLDCSYHDKRNKWVQKIKFCTKSVQYFYFQLESLSDSEREETRLMNRPWQINPQWCTFTYSCFALFVR